MRLGFLKLNFREVSIISAVKPISLYTSPIYYLKSIGYNFFSINEALVLNRSKNSGLAIMTNIYHVSKSLILKNHHTYV